MQKNGLKLGTAILCIVLAISALCFSLSAYSDASDPLVTLSYLTEIILPQMKQDILMEVATNNVSVTTEDTAPPTEQIDPVENETTATSPIPEAPASNSYTLLELTQGQKLYADSVLEMIVRPGSIVHVISPFEEQGIADITGKAEYLNGTEVAINSYCIIPRGGDGRGIEVMNEKSYILVRGEYSIG